MPEMTIGRIKPGYILEEDLQTGLGNVLFKKGKMLTEHDLEIMHSFLIQKAKIEDMKTAASKQDDDRKNVDNQEGVLEKTPFQEEYEAMFFLIQNTLNNIHALPIPLIVIRQQFKKLIDYIKEYNILTFVPPKDQLENYLVHSSITIGLTSYQLAKWHGFPEKDWIPIGIAGLFHDIGNVKIDPALLQKKAKLTEEENAEVRKHTIEGYNLLKAVPGINEGVKLTALQHHEREDGSGYPLKLDASKIHPYAKVVAVADIYHAMSSNRFYKKASSPYLVLEQLLNDSFGKLDPAIVQTFIQKVTQFHNGTLVRLSNGAIGEIVFTDRSSLTLPWVKVNGEVINLIQESHLHIEEVIKKG
ncbi:HD-GYP domain-containing protein [Marinicrinis lubricantis]|uniref:HD-GYP domain-containing protein n=1 Tax=Marinicrinis lubricantis TaxID=2086470 RepID=A0ABW1IHC4_9BACL